MTIGKDQDRYTKALHAMQSGVKMMQNYEHPDVHIPDNIKEASDSPKHLRVGVNTAMSDHAGLVFLLIDKGIITLEDYWSSMASQMEKEVHNYEQEISAKLRTKVTLL